jgi:hypothetical protein
VRETYFEQVSVEEVLKQIAEGACVSNRTYPTKRTLQRCRTNFPYPRNGTALWIVFRSQQSSVLYCQSVGSPSTNPDHLKSEKPGIEVENAKLTLLQRIRHSLPQSRVLVP